MFRRAFDWAIHHATGHILISWVLPLVFPVGAVVIGYVQNFSWFYIYLGAVFAAACGMSLLVRFSDWRIRNNIADNLAFTSGRFASDCDARGVTN